ncbi:hypothetical protein SD80_012430 [Scytonema tolypothrichoides VB-61278]|nr:hypothetical protein SD80_012430 [Scytonema tolypothrichoides VB-61278]
MNRKLKVVTRTFNYQEARRDCELENLAHDCSHYSLRIYCEGKLWDLNSDGTPSDLSEEQFWEIHPEYEAVSDEENAVGGIEVHPCSYPYYAVPMIRISTCGEAVEYTGAITCLKNDYGREVRECPNCAGRLVDWYEEDADEEETSSVPVACQGCKNYHGRYYGGTILICGIHPYGWNGDNCPDYQSWITEESTEKSSSSTIVPQRCDSLTQRSPEQALSTAGNLNKCSPAVITIVNEHSQNDTPARDDEILENFQAVPEDLIKERLRHHHAQMRHLRFFASIDSILSAIAGVCLFTAGVSASATIAAYGMGLMADGGVKQVQGVRWDNTVKITMGMGLVAGGGALGCGVLATASSVIEERTKP